MPKLLSSRAKKVCDPRALQPHFPSLNVYGFGACTACGNHSYRARANCRLCSPDQLRKTFTARSLYGRSKTVGLEIAIPSRHAPSGQVERVFRTAVKALRPGDARPGSVRVGRDAGDPRCQGVRLTPRTVLARVCHASADAQGLILFDELAYLRFYEPLWSCPPTTSRPNGGTA